MRGFKWTAISHAGSLRVDRCQTSSTFLFWCMLASSWNSTTVTQISTVHKFNVKTEYSSVTYFINFQEKERYKEPVRESLKALLAIGWSVEHSEVDIPSTNRSSMRRQSKSGGVSCINTYIYVLHADICSLLFKIGRWSTKWPLQKKISKQSLNILSYYPVTGL